MSLKLTRKGTCNVSLLIEDSQVCYTRMLYNISVHLGKIHRKKVWMKLNILNILYALKSKGKKMEMIQ